MIKIKRGMDIPIQGAPQQVIEDAPAARAVALVGFDYVGMKPTMAVREGERVKLGQLLFTDKKTEGVRYTAPASGVVSAINRGAKRVLQSVVIDVDGDDAEDFPTCTADGAWPWTPPLFASSWSQSGQWTALRTRPYSKVPAPDSEAAAIFVTAMDTHPLAADPAVVIAEQAEAFALGQDLLARLTAGKLYVCVAPGCRFPRGKAANIEVAEFDGPHPAGLAGTHVHFLEGVSASKMVWTIGYQDVIAIGRLFLDGRLYTERVVALAGPQVEKPRLLRTRLGADLQALCAGQMKERRKSHYHPARCWAGVPCRALRLIWGATTTRCRCCWRGASGSLWAGCRPGLQQAFQPGYLCHQFFRHQAAAHDHQHQWQRARHGAGGQLRKSHATGYPAHPVAARTDRRRYRDGPGPGLPGTGRGRSGPVQLCLPG